MKIDHFELYATDLPLKRPFRHAAAVRHTSESLVLKCAMDDGSTGYGEALPRRYVTGETREGAFDLLAARVLPALLGRSFGGLDDVVAFLREVDGAPGPNEGVNGTPAAAAWSAVDLALLDTVGRATGEHVRLPAIFAADSTPPGFSAVASAGSSVFRLLLMRLYGFRQVKLKVDDAGAFLNCRRARRVLGSACDLRVDANMAWSAQSAPDRMRELGTLGVRVFEQPLPPADLPGLAAVIRDRDIVVMADESATSRASLQALAASGACNGVNVRISKCGGLVAAHSRCREVLERGWLLQVGCHVGESSLLSAAQLILLEACPGVRYAEGCYGKHLLRADPFTPLLQFGYGGGRPDPPRRPGLGVDVDEGRLARWTVRRKLVATS